MIPVHKYTGRLGNLMFEYAYLYSQTKKGLIPDIYVQDPKYFENCSDDIRALYGSDIGFTDKVSIHVRRGDYLGSKFHFNLWDTDYYERAIKYFPNEKFLVFCADKKGSAQDKEDMNWCREYFTKLLGDRAEFREDKDEIDDMNTMASCKHNIIANSTFSWWAAWLNPNPYKKVIAPKQFYCDGVERTVCPREWIRI